MMDSNLISHILINHLWQATAIAAGLWLLMKWVKPRAAAVKYQFFYAAFLALAFLPAAAFLPGTGIEIKQAFSGIDRYFQTASAPAVLLVQLPLRERAKATAAAGSMRAQEQAMVSARTNPTAREQVPDAIIADIGVRAAKAKSDHPAVANAIPASNRSMTRVHDSEGLLSLYLKEKYIVGFLSVVWFLGIIWSLTQLVRGSLNARQLKTSGAWFADYQLRQNQRTIPVYASNEINSPMVIGLFKPTVMIPSDISDKYHDAAIQSLIAHEVAHIERNDLFASLLQRLALACFWWSPVMRQLSKAINEAREMACDEAAIKECGDAALYARSVLDMAERLVRSRQPLFAAGVLDSRSGLEKRIKSMMGYGPDLKTKGLKITAVGALALATSVAAFAAVTPRLSINDDDIDNPRRPQVTKVSPPVAEDEKAVPRNIVVQQEALKVRERLVDGPAPQVDVLIDQLSNSREALEKHVATKVAEHQTVLGLVEEADKNGQVVVRGVLASEAIEDIVEEIEEEREDIAELVSEFDGQIDAEETRELEADIFKRQNKIVRLERELEDSLRVTELLSRERILSDELRTLKDQLEALENIDELSVSFEVPDIIAAGEIGLDAQRIFTTYGSLAKLQAEKEALSARLSDAKDDVTIEELQKAIESLDKKIAGIEKAQENGIQLKEYTKNLRKLGRWKTKGDGIKRIELQPNIVFSDNGNNNVFRLVSTLIKPADTPLIAAARNGDADIVEQLLEAGANPNTVTADGETALSGAAANGHKDVVEILLEAKADPNLLLDDGQTALGQAAQNGNRTLVEVLLEANADPNLKDGDGNSPLYYAALGGHKGIVKLLLSAGAKP